MTQCPNNLVLNLTLPCGHTMTCSNAAASGTHGDSHGDSQWILQPANMLKFWVDNRVPRHRCELVSESNPMGLGPK